MKRQETRLERLESALQAAYRRELETGPVDVAAVMAGVHAAAAQRRQEARFLSRFLAAAAVAASLLVVASAWNGASPDSIALGGVTDSPWTVLIGPTLQN